MKNLFLLFLFICVGCQPKESSPLFMGVAMTMEYKIVVGKKISPSERRQIDKTIQTIFVEIDQVYNKWNSHSEISCLNKMKAGQKAPISPSLASFLLKTQEMVELSQGLFDPTIEPLQNLWKRELRKGKIPSDNEIAQVIPAIGWQNIHIDNGVFWKDHDLTSLDLGGIVKGHCIDMIVDRLKQMGYIDLYVEWGGEIKATGKHPEGRPWNVFISHLGSSKVEDAVDLISLHNQAIATSGDYLQYWNVDDKSYFHIFHPKTFQPLLRGPSSIASASVLAPNCAFADGLATTALLFQTLEDAESWAATIKKQYPEVTFWFVLRSSEKASKNSPKLEILQ